MDLTFTAEQELMAEAFRTLVSDLCAPKQLRVAFDGDRSLDETRWQRLAELGILGLLAPESSGGMGLTAVDMILIAESAGWAALPEAVSEHAGIAVPVLAEFATRPRAAAVLADAVTGKARIAVSHPANPFVLAADTATHFIIFSDDKIHLLDRQSVSLDSHQSIDALRHLSRVTATLNAANCLADGAPAVAALRRAFERGALFSAAECVGLCERMIQLAVAYASERSQFGKRIGSYQAIKHLLANAQVKLEFARPALYASAAGLVHFSEARSSLSISHAKLAAGDAAELAARTAIQVHGAMGYSWEVDLHFYMKRVWAQLGAWGDRSFHMRRVQTLLFESPLRIGPDQLFESNLSPLGKD